ncbi:MAG: DUF302 domain-containing protein [Rhodospirillales bacterium]
MRPILLTAAVAFLALAVAGDADAGEAVLYPYEGAFEDATFETREAILGQGLTIDYVSHVGEMLARTKEDVGGTTDIFANAEIYVFCSAVVSRRVMEADPMNVAHCPYNMFVIQMPGDDGAVYVGHRDLPDGSMQEVEDLLRAIALEATGG